MNHSFYLAAAYGAFVLALVIELWSLVRRHQRARRRLLDEVQS